MYGIMYSIKEILSIWWVYFNGSILPFMRGKRQLINHVATNVFAFFDEFFIYFVRILCLAPYFIPLNLRSMWMNRLNYLAMRKICLTLKLNVFFIHKLTVLLTASSINSIDWSRWFFLILFMSIQWFFIIACVFSIFFSHLGNIVFIQCIRTFMNDNCTIFKRRLSFLWKLLFFAQSLFFLNPHYFLCLYPSSLFLFIVYLFFPYSFFL